MTRRIVLPLALILFGLAAVFVVPTPSARAASNDVSPPAPAGICGKCNTGIPAFGPVPDFKGDPYSPNHGQCTWWVETQITTKNWNQHLGYYAYQWAAGARRVGWRVGTQAARGAAVVFQPWVQGAYGAGHIAIVMTVYAGGYWFLLSEMNFNAHGGGWDRVSYRWAHTGAGVSFIY